MHNLIHKAVLQPKNTLNTLCTHFLQFFLCSTFFYTAKKTLETLNIYATKKAHQVTVNMLTMNCLYRNNFKKTSLSYFTLLVSYIIQCVFKHSFERLNVYCENKRKDITFVGLQMVL